MDFDLSRSPRAALVALRYVEDVAHRVRRLFRRPGKTVDPVAWLIRTHRHIHRNGDAVALRRAYEVAEQMHRGQMRKSGEPYISHPLEVAQILAELGMDTTTLVAALLHDTVEDTSYTMPELHTDFGDEVGRLVNGVTKFDRVFYGDDAEVETIRKMVIAAGDDVRVLILKLADRLHNMRTIDARSKASRVRIARATQEVLIPLCERLGIQALKRELDDSVLAALEPEAHEILRRYVAHRPEWTAYTDAFIASADQTIKAAKLGARVIARPRHLYSIWKDTFADGYDEPHELPRIAIIVPGAVNDCYEALGVVHSQWRPVAGRFKDFIASPKNNLYRSLHTTVVGPDGWAIEVLIRTEAMHRDAEYGAASAFRFARRGPGAHSARGQALGRAVGIGDDHLEWLRRVVEWQRNALEPMRFIESLRCDLAEGRVHVFVEGDRMLLPANSTPVDVAYALGTETGNRCVAATVNGQLAFLSSPLTDGDVVEIHTARDEELAARDGQPVGPSAEWLTFVRTPQARLYIETYLREGRPAATGNPDQEFSRRVSEGRQAIGAELRRHQRGLATETPLVALSADLGYPNVEMLLVAVADGVVTAQKVVMRLIHQVDTTAVDAAVAAAAAIRR